MDTTLIAKKRDDNFGKGSARKMRATGMIPGVMYGGGSEATHLSISPKAMIDIFQATQNRNTVVQLDIDGEVTPCLVREVQRHPVNREILHVDFCPLVAGQVVSVDVPVTTSGKAIGEEIGGRIRIIGRTLKVSCSYEKIPSAINVDVTALDVGDFIRASQVVAVDGVEVEFESDFNIVTCYGKSGPDEFELEEAAAAEAAAAAAAESESGAESESASEES